MLPPPNINIPSLPQPDLFATPSTTLHPDPSGALWYPAASTLIVADLHLEKGSSFAQRGIPLPPYDTRATLACLAECLARLKPRRVVCLGDSFHDAEASGRIDEADAAVLASLIDGRDWLWVSGNHDPLPPRGVGGRAVEGDLALGPLVLRHQAAPVPEIGAAGAREISGHFHPKASLRVHGRRVTGRCFVEDGTRLMLPAFGAYTGGLDVCDPAIRGHFPGGFSVHLIGRSRMLLLTDRQLCPAATSAVR